MRERALGSGGVTLGLPWERGWQLEGGGCVEYGNRGNVEAVVGRGGWSC